MSKSPSSDFPMGDPLITIRAMDSQAEAQWCARLTASCEPWLTLGRDYEAALAILEDPGIEKYVALIDEQPAGFVLIVMQGALVGYIKMIAVAPEWRNRGLGRQLLAYAEKRIFAGSPNAFLLVSTFNQDARRLYERQGYQLIGLLPDYIVRGHGEYLMRKSIGPISEFAPSPRVEDGRYALNLDSHGNG